MNTRVLLTALSKKTGRPATLDDIPDTELARIAEMGFDWIWLLSVWQTGEAGKRISQTNPELKREFQETLTDLCDDDISGSGFAVTGYVVHPSFGGDAALARLRERIRRHGLRLMLDFVPNHMGLDHPWIDENPGHFVAGTEEDLTRRPDIYTRIKTKSGQLILAHGRDPNFSGWSDTLQLNYANPATREAMTNELLKIAGQCDGVRCDMAMLLLPEVFQRTWGLHAEPFWPDAIARARQKTPGFCFMAEVYWGLERTLLDQGFDYAYDKTLYDRLREGRAEPVREHLHDDVDYQTKLARFLENHDEPRAASVFASGQHEAAAVITFLIPGLRFLHQGQLEGRLKRISPHLCRAPDEPVNEQLAQFYQRLLSVLREPVVRTGHWQLLDCGRAWQENGSSNAFISYAWQGPDDARLLVAVNYSDHASQCFVRVPFPDLQDGQWDLRDLTSDAHYERDGNDLAARGLYLDVPPWHYHVFRCARSAAVLASR